MKCIPVFFSIVCAAFALRAVEPQALPPDRVLHLEEGGAKAMLVLPAGIGPCRGVIVHVANMKREPSARWTEIARSMHFAHMVMSIDMKQNNRPRKLRDAVGPLLIQAAEQLERPEIATAPLATTGHSAGGMGLPAFLPLKDRLMTAAIDCSWVHDFQKEPEAGKIPMLFILGSISDDFNMLPAIPDRYDPARKQGALAALSLEWGKAHSYGNAGTLSAAWMVSVASKRLPIGAEKMVDLKEEDGWLGDRATWESANPQVYPWAEYPGDKSGAVWLPDRGFAFVWRAYQSNHPPVQLSVSTADGARKLAPFTLSAPHEMTAPADSELLFAPENRGGAALRHIRYYNSDVLLGESQAEPWTVTVKLPAGAHPVFAEVTLQDGSVCVTNPALLILQPRRDEVEVPIE